MSKELIPYCCYDHLICNHHVISLVVEKQFHHHHATPRIPYCCHGHLFCNRHVASSAMKKQFHHLYATPRIPRCPFDQFGDLFRKFPGEIISAQLREYNIDE
jgi:hypothetical protein